MNKSFSKQEYEERIKVIFPNANFSIVKFSGYKNDVTILCKKCNNEFTLKRADDLFNRVNFCSCDKEFKNFHEKIDYLSTKFDFTVIEKKSASEKQIIKCNKCNTVMHRHSKSILKTPWHCDVCNNYAKGRSPYKQKDIQERLNNQFNNQYELLEYQGLTKPALIKHNNCGLIFKIRDLGDLFDGRNRGCPKCYQFKSKGEQAIQNYLEANNIEYIPQKTFSPLNKTKYRFDFFLPTFNLAIEYQGEQHYRDNGFFKDDLNTVQKRDAIKRQYCINNNIDLLEIKYTDFNCINKILTSKLNDYRKLINEQSSVK